MASIVRHIPEAPNNPYRLGRNLHHDSASLSYAVGVLPKSAIVSRHWERQIPVLDQGNLGSCTGNASTGWIGTDNALRQGIQTLSDGTPVNEDLAIAIYGRATEIDPFEGTYPPDDTGSDGLSVAKVLQSMGLVASYTHAFSREALASALQSGSVLIGIEWYNSMFEPHSDGGIPVSLSSGLAGGHEVVVDQLEVVDQGDHDRYWITNSWSTSWGQQGRAFFTGKDIRTLLSRDGDVTVPLVAVSPVPPPTPPVDVDVQYWSVAQAWAKAKGFLS